jgi:hypothetical protein
LVAAHPLPVSQPYHLEVWLLEDIAGNLATVVILVLGGSLLYRLTRRHQASRFFHAKSNGVLVYTSRLFVPKFSSTGVNGEKRSYEGPAIPGYEGPLTAEIEAFFASLTPSMRHLVGGRLASLSIRWGDIGVRTDLSPERSQEVNTSDTLFIIGSPAYNLAAGTVELDFNPFARFDAKGGPIYLRGSTQLDDRASCIVERSVHPRTGQRAFVVAGFATEGTAGAARYLLNNWHSLYKRYGADAPFCVALRMTGPSFDQPEEVQRLS